MTENCKLHFPQTHIDKTVFSVQPTDQNQKDMQRITITKWKEQIFACEKREPGNVLTCLQPIK